MKVVIVVLLFVSSVWSNDSKRYVCYTQKNTKGIYTGCRLRTHNCKKYNMNYFGKYPNEASTYSALARCKNSTPKKIAHTPILKQLRVEKIGHRNSFRSFGLSGGNKQDNYYQRFRSKVETTYPNFVKRYRKELELFILDKVEGSYMAFYRSALSTSLYFFEVVIYSEEGKILNEINLSKLIYSKYALEIQDIRYKEGILYFNAASLTYVSTTKGVSASLYAYDLTKQKLLWQSKYLLSNDIFLVEDNYIISGYGFTGERDYLYLLDKKNGKVLSKKRLDSAHDYLEYKGNKLYVITYRNFYTFTIQE